MKRLGVIVASLSLIGAGPALGADEKADPQTKHEGDRNASTKVERTAKQGDATQERTSEVERSVRPGGKVETKKRVKRSYKPAGKARAEKSEVEEKTVRDSSGKVVEEERKAK